METLRFHADLASLKDATAFFRTQALSAGIAESSLDQLDLVLEELVVYIALYAYPVSTPGIIQLTCSSPSKGKLQVEVADQGAPFYPLTIPHPQLADTFEERKAGGLGIFIATSWTDSMSYRRDLDWNRLSFSVSSDHR